MLKIRAARMWVATAGLGAIVFVLSVAGLIRSCELARSARAGTIASLIEKDADYWRPRGSHQR